MWFLEFVAIILSIPVAAVASVLYCLLLQIFVKKEEVFSRILLRISIYIFWLFWIEVAIVFITGPLFLQDLTGDAYFIVHLLLLVSVVPSFANIVMLQKRYIKIAKWYLAWPFCTILALYAVLFYYHVSEALFGIQ